MDRINTLKNQWRTPLMSGVSWSARIRYYGIFTLLSLLTILFMHLQFKTPLSLAEFSTHLLLLMLSVVFTLIAVEASGFVVYRQRDWPLNVTPRTIWLTLFPLVTGISFIGCVVGMSAFEFIQEIAEKHEQQGYHPHHFLNHSSFVFIIILIIHGTMIHHRNVHYHKQGKTQNPQASGPRECRLDCGSPRDESNIHLSMHHNLKSENSTLRLKHDGQESLIPVSTISHIQVDENYCHFWLCDHAAARRVTVRSTLRDITDRLPGTLFVRTHRSYVVNLQHVKKIKTQGSSHFALTDSGFSVPISKRRIQSINDRLKEEHYAVVNSTPVVKQLLIL